MLQEATYEQKKGPPRILWDDYVRTATERWHQLLASDPPETDVQRFLEENPAFVSGAWTPPPLKSGHCPFLRALISQPKLPGFNHRQPDFLWVSTHSLEWFPTLIEIERPGKKLFTKEGRPTAEFTQARNQLAQWRTWFSDPTNVQTFIREYGIPDYLARSRQMKLHMILIYGRRAEFENDAGKSKHRGSLLTGNDEALMSFDRLTPDSDLDLMITVRPKGNAQYEAIHVPETFGLGPFQVRNLSRIEGLADAIRRADRIRNERKEFLIERLRYWSDWLSTSKGGIRSPEFIE